MFLSSHLSILCLSFSIVESFLVQTPDFSRPRLLNTKLQSFYSDSSDYKSSDSDFSSDDETGSAVGVPVQAKDANEDTPTIEETPVPMSKNSGNRFVALIFDQAISALRGEEDIDVLELHDERVRCTEDHVMFCRKTNLYNETFNSESMADILWSHQM